MLCKFSLFPSILALTIAEFETLSLGPLENVHHVGQRLTLRHVVHD